MPVSAQAPPSQPETRFGLRELASSHGVAAHYVQDRMLAVALSQGITPSPNWFDSAAFVLATREQVENENWCREQGVSLFVRCTGASTAPFRYPSMFKEFAKALPVQWKTGRDQALDAVLWDIVAALSQGGCVVVHCNQSFHRGPLGFMAILRRLFGFEPRTTMQLIVENRTVYEAYKSEDIMNGYGDILKVYRWAVALALWNPPPLRTPDDTWGGAKGGGKTKASSQGRGASSQGRGASSSAAASSASSQVAAIPVPATGRRWVPKEDVSAQGVSADAARAKATKGFEPRWKGRYLYRAMTEDLREFVDVGGSPPWVRGATLAKEGLKAVQIGSSVVSPFVHFSWRFEEARHWYIKGKRRGEVNNIMCRVDSQALSQAPDLASALSNLSYVDLSTQKSCQPYIGPWVGNGEVQDRLEAIGHAQKVAEVLVAWRGQIPRRIFEVIDADSGEFLRNLDESVQWISNEMRTI